VLQKGVIKHSST